MRVALIGYGYIGRAYHRLFPDAVPYDPFVKTGYWINEKGNKTPVNHTSKADVNKCDAAIIAVPTNLKDGRLDSSIVEEVISWLKTPLIIIKSTMNPGDTTRLAMETGKRIVMSPEYAGQGGYYVPPQYPDPEDPSKHSFLVVGGEEEAASEAAELLWSKMSPTTKIHIVSAEEAELSKLLDNAYGALKLTWANAMRQVIEKGGQNYIKTHQAVMADPRIDGMHQRATGRGWNSHCYEKDLPALATHAEKVESSGMKQIIELVVQLNKQLKEAYNERAN